MSTRTPCVSEDGDCDGKDPLNVFDRLNCSENTTTTILYFQYQIQTTAALPLAQIQSSEALRSLEDAMTDLLRQSFAQSACSEAWSAAPTDALLPGLAGVTCHSRLVPTADRCLVLGGALTVPASDILEGRSHTLLRQAMTEGHFNQVHPQIPDVIFVSDEAFVHNAPSSESTLDPVKDNIPLTYNRISNDTSNSGTDPVWAWILFPIGFVAIVVAFVVHHRYCSSRRYSRPKIIETTPQRPRRDISTPGRLGSFPASTMRQDETEASTSHWGDDDFGKQHADIVWDPPPQGFHLKDGGLFPSISYYDNYDDDDEELYHNSVTSSSPGHSSSGGGVQGSGRFPIAAAWM